MDEILGSPPEKRNQIPYMYDPLWLEYEKHYQIFHGLQFVKDLSIDTPLFYCPILLFKDRREGEKFYCRGYNNGIAGPFFKQNKSPSSTDVRSTVGINRLHLKSRTTKINEAYRLIWNKIANEVTPVESLTIIQYPRYSYYCHHLLRPTNDNLPHTVKYWNAMAYMHQVSNESNESNLGASIKAELNTTLRNRLNRYDCGTTYDQKLIEVIDHHTDRKRICETFCAYRHKHTELSGRETKPDICWNILEQLIHAGKAILVHYSQSEFVYFLYSTEFSYYASNACTRGAEIGTILIYEAMKWVIAHGCSLIYYGEMVDERGVRPTSQTMEFFQTMEFSQKLLQISRYKEKFSNTIFQGYSLETMRCAPHPSTAT